VQVRRGGAAGTKLGIRAALGASVPQLTALIVAEGGRLAVAGVTPASAAAWLVAQAMRAIPVRNRRHRRDDIRRRGRHAHRAGALASYIPARLASRADSVPAAGDRGRR